jgi:hypothetical protein
MSTMTLPQRNGSAHGIHPWLKLTVQQFFQDINWENLAPAQSEPPSSASEPASDVAPPSRAAAPTLTLSVSQFFEAIAWDGTPTIAAPPTAASPETSAPTPDSNITLDDFFGSF